MCISPKNQKQTVKKQHTIILLTKILYTCKVKTCLHVGLLYSFEKANYTNGRKRKYTNLGKKKYDTFFIGCKP